MHVCVLSGGVIRLAYQGSAPPNELVATDNIAPPLPPDDYIGVVWGAGLDGKVYIGVVCRKR